ncbi:MAG: DUF4962 domain-containing protein [Thermoguttaceae bacterium]
MRFSGLALLLLLPGVVRAAPVQLDQRPARAGEWGYRPDSGAVVHVTPPGFCWRPQQDIASWEIECYRGAQLSSAPPAYRATGIIWNVHCPPRAFEPGQYTWRYRGLDRKGQKTGWSTARTFTIAQDAVPMPLPPREELLARIPKSHPRLFIRPEDVPRLRKLARGPLKDRYQQLVRQCERLLASPPPTAEPPKYPPGTVRLSEAWREIWWGNRLYTIAALDGAATLGFAWLLGGNEQYGQLGRRILLDCAKWDPRGATGFRYNDEAGMPYAYYFSRAYTFLYDLLSDQDRALCRRVMKARGDEMFDLLCPRHFWTPYNSHANRAWHFLGEVGIAFLGEVDGAEDWVWFAMNVFANVYPVWADEDGGWHEGGSYWASYLSRFTWWADVMRAATGIDAYKKPFFSQAGYYAMYVMPPGKIGGGFGDLAENRRASDNVLLMSILAAQAGNGHWQWYVEQMGGPQTAGGYVGLIRGQLPKVAPRPPDDLPASRLFRGTGQAFLNTTLASAQQGVQVAFKSSPFGSQSHGYDAQNAFQLWAYGQRLLVSSGHRDIHGSDHHRKWMWSTRSTNNITVDGQGQVPHSAGSQGRIVAFRTTPGIDIVIGEAGQTYRAGGAPDGEPLLDRYSRAILFVKPELVIVFDRLVARVPARFEYWLHSPEKFAILGPQQLELHAGEVSCPITVLAPEGLQYEQTDQYDPNPRPRVRLREWHLTAATSQKTRSIEFVVLLRPHRRGQPVAEQAELKRLPGGYALSAGLADGRVLALLPTDDAATLQSEGLKTRGRICLRRFGADGAVIQTLDVGQ